MKSYVSDYIKELTTTLEDLDGQQVDDFSKSILQAYHNDRNIYVIGNGGSAASASHMATDFGKGAAVEHLKRIKISSLTDNIALITAIANDVDYGEVFKFQLENVLKKEEMVIAISASGNSENVVRAIKYANKVGAETVGLVGFTGGKLLGLCQSVIHVKNCNYGIVEDVHMVVVHAVSQHIKSELAHR